MWEGSGEGQWKGRMCPAYLLLLRHHVCSRLGMSSLRSTSFPGPCATQACSRDSHLEDRDTGIDNADWRYSRGFYSSA